jgi:putative nucleotidyltransferase with HDIG domain
MRQGLDTVGELVGAIQRLGVARTLDDIQEVVRTAARRLTGADGATFVLREGAECFYADEDAIAPLWKGRRFPMGACVSGWAMQQGETVVIPDIYADPRVPHEVYRATFVKTICMVPIRMRDPIGAIGNYWAAPRDVSASDIQLLQALAESAAAALQHVRVLDELEEARAETLQRLANAAEYRDDDTFHHTERVGMTSAAIAAQLGLDSDFTDVLRQAAPLHDIGKIALRDSVLLKKGRLTEEERQHVNTHVTAGAAILHGTRSAVLRMAREIVLSHHEWWNGKGYPGRVAGEGIPLSGRIVAAADVFDALTHSRPYKAAWPVDQAVATIQELRGSQFDPRVVDAFVAIDHRRLVNAGSSAFRPGMPPLSHT